MTAGVLDGNAAMGTTCPRWWMSADAGEIIMPGYRLGSELLGYELRSGTGWGPGGFWGSTGHRWWSEISRPVVWGFYRMRSAVLLYHSSDGGAECILPVVGDRPPQLCTLHGTWNGGNCFPPYPALVGPAPLSGVFAATAADAADAWTAATAGPGDPCLLRVVAVPAELQGMPDVRTADGSLCLSDDCSDRAQYYECTPPSHPSAPPTSSPATSHPSAPPTSSPATSHPSAPPTSSPATSHPSAPPTGSHPSAPPTSSPATSHPSAPPTGSHPSAPPTSSPATSHPSAPPTGSHPSAAPRDSPGASHPPAPPAATPTAPPAAAPITTPPAAASTALSTAPTGGPSAATSAPPAAPPGSTGVVAAAVSGPVGGGVRADLKWAVPAAAAVVVVAAVGIALAVLRLRSPTATSARSAARELADVELAVASGPSPVNGDSYLSHEQALPRVQESEDM
eukprot:TRINITY_DN2920_c0_g1_i3.p1 TRINITY_DN2920_c0_g1~~TRINITY_DN2920_c0_g1_i3.p1  ORF type:complete len:453 (+),score=86.14 TRINITY_DN2920_c0_g1_i3:731-2089(+)